MTIIFISSNSYPCINMMKVCPSLPSSKKHYNRKKIMLRETNVLNN
jgi:hypothetical protein